MHINENVIEKYVICRNSLEKVEIDEIESHFANCKKCKELHDYFVAFYNQYKSLMNCEPDEIDQLIAKKHFEKEINPSIKFLIAGKSVKLTKSDYNITNIKTNFNFYIQKVIKEFIDNPIKGLSISFVFVIILGLSFNIVVNTFFQRPIPDYGVNENGYIKIYNYKDELLWKIKTYNIPNIQFDSLSFFEDNKSNYAKLIDIDDDGKKELLLAASIYETQNNPYKDTLYCFNSDGSLRWKAYPETEKFNYAPHWRRTNWIIEAFIPIKTKNGKKILLIANEGIYAGSIISLIEPETGEITSSTYLAGHTKSVLLIDLNDDSYDEVVLGGISTYKLPRLVVLTTDYFMGVTPDYYSENMNLIKSNCLYFILLPITEYGEKYTTKGFRSIPNLSKYKPTGGITAITVETQIDLTHNGGLVFSFDKKFNCVHISTNTYYSEHYNKFFEDGIVKEKLTYENLQKFKVKILYWDGDKFVNYPTMNKYWNQNFVDANGNAIKVSQKNR